MPCCFFLRPYLCGLKKWVKEKVKAKEGNEAVIEDEFKVFYR
jgi:hypothetical protein